MFQDFFCKDITLLDEMQVIGENFWLRSENKCQVYWTFDLSCDILHVIFVQ